MDAARTPCASTVRLAPSKYRWADVKEMPVATAAKLLEVSRDLYDGTKQWHELYHGGDTLIHPCFDIDEKLDYYPDAREHGEKVQDCVDSLFKVVKVLVGQESVDIAVLCASRPCEDAKDQTIKYKFSLHIIFPELAISVDDNRDLATWLLKNELVTGVDLGIYPNTRRVMRCAWCAKDGEPDTTLKPLTTHALDKFFVTNVTEDHARVELSDDMRTKAASSRVVDDTGREDVDVDPEDIHALLGMIRLSATDAYGKWVSVGMNVKAALDDAGFDAWHEWSREQPGYKSEDDCDKVWRGLGATQCGNGIGALCNKAKADDPDRYAAWRAEKRQLAFQQLQDYVIKEDINVLDGKLREYDVVKAAFERDHFFVQEQTVYCKEKADGTLVKYTRKQFCEAYEHLPYGVWKEDKGQRQLEKKDQFVLTWMKDPTKRTYSKLHFAPPPIKLEQGGYNTFRGFLIDNVSQGVVPATDIAPFMDYVGIQCKHNPQHIKYLLSWLAHLMQRPGDKTNNVMTLIYSPKGKHGLGSGKSHLIELIGECILGSTLFLQTADINHLVGSHAEGAEHLLVLYEEVAGADTCKNRNDLFNLISAQKVRINPKYMRPYDVDNLLRIWGTTNNDVAVEGGRRFFVTDASLERVGDSAYHAAFDRWMRDPPNTLAVYEHLKSIDITDWHAEQCKPKSDLMDIIDAVNAPKEVWLMKDIVIEMYHTQVTELTLPSSKVVERYVSNYIPKSEDDTNTRKTYNKFVKVLPQRIKSHNKAFESGAIAWVTNWSRHKLNAFVFQRDKLKEYVEAYGLTIDKDELVEGWNLIAEV